MEGDDEWEDHLIVSYTPPQGCEMTMTEFERLKANTKLEIFRIHNDMTPEELEAIPAECSKTVAVCRELAGKMREEKKYLYFLGPSSTPGEYWAGVGMRVYKVDTRQHSLSPVCFEGSNYLRYVVEWNHSIVVFCPNTEPVILDADFQVVRRLKHNATGSVQKCVVTTSDGFLYYLWGPGTLIRVAPDYTYKVMISGVKDLEWDQFRQRLVILQGYGILSVTENSTEVDLTKWLEYTSEDRADMKTYALLSEENKESKISRGGRSVQVFRILRDSKLILMMLDSCQLCIICPITLQPTFLSDPPKVKLRASVQMGLCKPVRGVEMVLCSTEKHQSILSAVFRKKVYLIGVQSVTETFWGITWVSRHPIIFGAGYIGVAAIKISSSTA